MRPELPKWPRATRSNRRTSRRIRWPAWAIIALLGATISVATIALSSAPVPPSSPAPAQGPATTAVIPLNSSTGPHGTWAWGAAANFSLQLQYVGAYNASTALAGGNLTPVGSYIAFTEAASIAYASYAIVNATSPASGQLYVTVQAVELRALSLRAFASGTFPLAGNYTTNTSVPLQPLNVSVAITERVLDASAAYLNFTAGANGSLALQNEHVEMVRGVNISLTAVNFPNVTQLPGGGWHVSYVNGAIAAQAWVATNVTATFSPALPLVVGPLYVGKSWNGTTTAKFVGVAAYAEAIQATNGAGQSFSTSSSGSVAVNATVPISLSFTVVGTRTVYFPGGGSETDFVIAYTDGSGNAGMLESNGLIVLPASDPTHGAGVPQAVPVRPATTPLAPKAGPPSMVLYSPHRQMADSQLTSPQPGSSVTASPMSVSQAHAAMVALGHPTAPPPRSVSSPVGLLVAGTVVVMAVGIGVAVALWRKRPVL